jgi:hypothetical protein
MIFVSGVFAVCGNPEFILSGGSSGRVLMGLRWRVRLGASAAVLEAAFEAAVGKDDTSVGARPGASAAVLDAWGAVLKVGMKRFRSTKIYIVRAGR